MAGDAPDERTTRERLIDAQLARAGWTGSRRRVVEEFALRGPEAAEPGGEWSAGSQFADYVLLDAAGQPIAVVEATRTSPPIPA